MTSSPPTQEEIESLAAEAARLGVDVDVPRAVALGIDLETLRDQVRFAAAHQTAIPSPLSALDQINEAASSPRFQYRSLSDRARELAAAAHGYSPPAGGLVAAARRAARATQAGR